MLNRAVAPTVLCALMSVAWVSAQTDPGPQQGTGAAGRPLPRLTPTENAAFQEGANRFRELDSVTGTEPGAPSKGLGPRFNLNSCAGCHAHPAAGGSSPQTNPQIAVATEYGARNVVPAFIKASGPIRVARFVLHADGAADGGVSPLFTIAGRTDAGSCALAQPDFGGALAHGNVIFRIPTPLYGAGLIEAIPDDAILANQAANAQAKAALGISGHANRNANDGSISRFGWKAQVRSLEEFAAEAYNVEMGVSNALFRSERDGVGACALNALPEDQMDFTQNSPVRAMSDVSAFAEFMRWLAPPNPPGQNPPAQNPSIGRGRQMFSQSGCDLCHSPVLTTGNTTSAALANQPAPLFSDLLVHHMGTGLADSVTQGSAAGDEFRTAPLWGLGQRIYLLHDGRTTDLLQAIRAHASQGSEAAASVAAFNALPAPSVQDVLNFLRSL